MSFLRFPPEIRLKILQEAISSPADAPSCPAASQEGRTSPYSGIWQLLINNPALSLLLVNRQIHVEAKDVLRRLPANYYHVDIMFVKSYGLWTTWTIPAPPRTQYIDSVHASFRLFEPTKDLDPRFERSLNFQSGDGGPPVAVWSLYDLLSGLIRSGPGYLGWKDHLHKKGLAPQFVVKRIIIDISAPTDGVTHESILWEDGEHGRLRRWEINQGPHNPSIPPEERIADYMVSFLDILLSLSYYSMNYGTFLYESVLEDITILVRGQEYKRYDMNQLMEKHKVTYWGGTPEFIAQRQEAHAKWLTWVHERRRRMGEGLDLGSDRPVTTIM